MKKLLAMMLMLLPMLAGAQELVNFVLMPDGTYQTEDGKDFVVIPFEGKTAHQLYTMIATNVGSVYNDPSKVMSGVEDVSIKIRAYSPNLCSKKVVLTHNGGGYYQLEFKFKDERIRISAPYIENKIEFNTQPASYGYFRDIVSKWYKNGVLKEKNKKDYDAIVSQINTIINAILHISTVQDATEEW